MVDKKLELLTALLKRREYMLDEVTDLDERISTTITQIMELCK